MIRYIKVYDNVMDPMACNKLVKSFERNMTSHTSINGNGSRYEEMIITEETRIWNEYGPQLMELYNIGLNTYRKECGLKTSKQIPDKMGMEQFSLKKYVANDPGYKQRIHSDSTERGTHTRFITAMIYLTTPEQRGETEFPSIKLKITPLQGSMIIFPSTWTYMYSENPCMGLISKYTLTTHFRAQS
jgi:hypothetical protein